MIPMEADYAKTLCFSDATTWFCETYEPSPVAAESESSFLSGNRRAIGRRRWLICALVFFATTINYVDRTVLGLLAPMLQVKIGWNEAQYGYIVTSFQVAYALGLLVMGPLIDRVGSRIGYAIAVAIWSVSAMAHSLARSVVTFAMARFGLGFGEAGNFPSALKTVAEWFPQRERALATGIFNSGTNIGATFAPLLVPWIALHLGWQYAFLMTGAFSAIWIVCWLKIYRRPQEDAKLSAAELDYIQSDRSETAPKIPWARLLRHRQAWTFILGKFLTDPVWWFFLYWLPKFLSSEHHATLSGLALPLIAHLQRRDVGQYRRRLVAGEIHESRLDGQSRPQDDHADLRLCCRTGYLSSWHQESMGRGGGHQSGRRRTPGLVVQLADVSIRHVSLECSCVGREPWNIRWRRQWRHDRHDSRTAPKGDRQLRATVYLCRLYVFVYLVFDSASFSAAEACNAVVSATVHLYN